LDVSNSFERKRSWMLILNISFGRGTFIRQREMLR
jgi:hypothetical protein